MRERTIKQQIYLNTQEKNLLKEKSKKAGMNESEFLRSCIKGYKIKEQPTKEIREFTRDISGIANNINQIARAVNSTRYIRDEDLEYIKYYTSIHFRISEESIFKRITKGGWIWQL